jgi:hypothetical protein
MLSTDMRRSVDFWVSAEMKRDHAHHEGGVWTSGCQQALPRNEDISTALYWTGRYAAFML